MAGLACRGDRYSYSARRPLSDGSEVPAVRLATLARRSPCSPGAHGLPCAMPAISERDSRPISSCQVPRVGAEVPRTKLPYFSGTSTIPVHARGCVCPAQSVEPVFGSPSVQVSFVLRLTWLTDARVMFRFGHDGIGAGHRHGSWPGPARRPWTRPAGRLPQPRPSPDGAEIHAAALPAPGRAQPRGQLAMCAHAPPGGTHQFSIMDDSHTRVRRRYSRQAPPYFSEVMPVFARKISGKGLWVSYVVVRRHAYLVLTFT